VNFDRGLSTRVLFFLFYKVKYAVLFLSILPGLCVAQDQWKNIYSQPAWEARDKWQKPHELIRLLQISEGSRVADIGSHEGYMSFKLAARVGRRGKVYAVDLLQARLDKLKERAEASGLSQIQTVKGEPANPLLPANSLDAVLILDTYHEIREHAEMLRHIKTALKSGGRLVLCEPIADSRRALARAEQERKHELSMAFALEDLKKAGFVISFEKDNFIDRTEEKGDKMWVIVATKPSL
jgi:ubiquinone/menaquinone biosynthesis C-methylase UbiE